MFRLKVSITKKVVPVVKTMTCLLDPLAPLKFSELYRGDKVIQGLAFQKYL